VTQPTATALIPAHQEAATIAAVLAAIGAQTYPISRVIVVADACTDHTAATAKAAGAEVHLTWHADKAAAQNTVLPLITTDLVVGFDGDTLPTPTCVERMVARMERDQLAAACATVLPVQTRGMFIRARQYAYALGRRWWRVAQSAVGCPQVLTGAAYVFRTPAIKGIGGFPTVGISADMDATWALMAAGHRLAYVGDALAYTYDPETFSQYRAQMRRWAAGYFQTMAKHRRQLLRPRAMLVAWTGLFDLLTLPVTYGLAGWWLLTDPSRVKWLPAWFLGHLAVTTALVATVVGWRDAVLGAVPYTIVNYYNKALYLWTMAREWGLGAHYRSWTGRAGRPTLIDRPDPWRVAALAGVAGLVAVGVRVL
jgi:biofilm PGA synthesis N-glycosyltransferase PgaC